MRPAFGFILALGFGLTLWQPRPLTAQPRQRVQWIWLNEGDPAQAAAPETCYFRRSFHLDKPVDEAVLDIAADDEFTVWLNGTLLGKGNDWKRVYAFNVRPHMARGKNVLAVEAHNKEAAAGVMVRLGYVPNGQSKVALVSDGAWKAAKNAGPGWEKVEFDDAAWSRVKVLGPYGEVGPWKGQIWDSGGDDRFAVPKGFHVEQAVKNPNRSDPFSLVNLTFDAKGRLLVSQERGPILLCTSPDKSGVMQTVMPYCTQVRNCQGMCWVKDALLLVGDGPQGTGLYRVRDVDNDDKTDDVTLLHKFPRVPVPNYGTQGGMGEHGPHAIMHGPDDWLYLVVGNHAWAQPDKLAANSPLVRWPTGQLGPDQGQPNSTEDVLLPRLNDGRGHAANILAPGGTIWRMDHEGKNMSLVAAGFRNHYDAAFSRSGELFTYDSDMEWDEALPWYRAVRVCHCPPGADFVWRTGSANTPDYYVDSLPPAVETGRGSPVGVEFYDHSAFPENYRGAFFVGDWAIGVIYAVHLNRDGGSFKGVAQRFCTGNPMNVTDLIVGPDGALYFTMGGRGSQGGVYRIVYKGGPTMQGLQQSLFNTLAGRRSTSKVDQALQVPQPFSAWGRARIAKVKQENEKEWASRLQAVVQDQAQPVFDRLRALDYLQWFGPKPDAKLLVRLTDPDSEDDSPQFIRGNAVWLLGLNAYPEGRQAMIDSLRDESPLVRRRACEAILRAGFEPPLDELWPILGNDDRFVRTAGRLVLQRIDPKKWTDRIWKEKSDYIAFEGIVALCKTHEAGPYAEQIFERLSKVVPGHRGETSLDAIHHHLDFLRTLQLALIHTQERPATVKALAQRCLAMFPHENRGANRELAILLTHFRREGHLTEPVHAKMLDVLLTTPDDKTFTADAARQQQIHYFSCLRLLYQGWTPEQKSRLLAWYDSTKSWEGGHSFAPFLENMLRDLNPVFDKEDRNRIIARASAYSRAAVALLKFAPPQEMPSPALLGQLYGQLAGADRPMSQSQELKEVIVDALGRDGRSEAQAELRKIADRDPSQRDTVARGLAKFPSTENWPYLVRGLQSPHSFVLVEVIRGLRQIPVRPKVDPNGAAIDPEPYRTLLLASGRLEPTHRWKAVELLRQWGKKKFSPDEEDWKTELENWARWFTQTFPKEPSLPNVTAATTESKWKFDELLTYLEKNPDGKTGNVLRGRAVFEKASCLKCHKFGKEGEGLGPDLTTLKGRFKRTDILESIQYPSKVISDQYRGSSFLTKQGVTVTGLAAPQGNTITVLQLDGTKVTLKTDEIDQQVASTISSMPEKLLDELTLQEIADLFAFLESEPPAGK